MSLTTGLLLLASNSLLCLLSSLNTVYSPLFSVLAAVTATTLVATMKYRWIYECQLVYHHSTQGGTDNI